MVGVSACASDSDLADGSGWGGASALVGRSALATEASVDCCCDGLTRRLLFCCGAGPIETAVWPGLATLAACAFAGCSREVCGVAFVAEPACRAICGGTSITN